jgi:hypothetical protein
MPARSAPLSSDNVAIPFKLRLNGEELSFISTTMIFGTPVDITLSELALETFFPADEATPSGCAASRRHCNSRVRGRGPSPRMSTVHEFLPVLRAMVKAELVADGS